MTAYARSPNKLPPEWGDRVRVIIGELSDAVDRKATGMPLVDGTRHILDAMKRHGVPRYIGTRLPASSTPREAHLADQARRLSGPQGLPVRTRN